MSCTACAIDTKPLTRVTSAQKVQPKPKTKEFYKEKYDGLAIFSVFTILLLIWAIVGFIAFVTSIVCFGKNGTMTDNIVGLFLSIITGPFYFIYYYTMKPKGYC